MSNSHPTPYEIVRARQESLDKRTFVLAPSAMVLKRPGGKIQFGCDGFSAGVIGVEPEHFYEVFSILKSCAVNQESLATKLTEAGLDEIAAQTLIADLTTYGILREVGPKPRVVVIGTTRAARMIKDMLTRSGVQVRQPLHDEEAVDFINRTPPNVPVVLVDYLPQVEELAPMLSRRPNVVPTAAHDTKAVVGPVRIGGRGPCINCAFEYYKGKDPQWGAVTSQYQPEIYDPIVESTLAAHAAAITAAMVGIQPCAGTQPYPVTAGAVTNSDPFSLTTTHTVMRTHPMCTYCHQVIAAHEEWKVLAAT